MPGSGSWRNGNLSGSSAAARAEGLILHRGDLVVTSGDSITYMSHYSRLVEIYLLVTRPELELRVMKCQRGCGGSAGEFVANTLEEELVGLKPKVHTVCFGMNDGGRGQPWREATGEAYARALRRIVERNRQNGTLTLVASPGVVDGLSYTVGPGAAPTVTTARWRTSRLSPRKSRRRPALRLPTSTTR